MASLNASFDNPRLSSDSILYKAEIVEFSEDDMLRESGEDVMFENALFFLSTRAAEENVAGKTKLTAINRKHLANKGVFFRIICSADQAANISLKPKA